MSGRICSQICTDIPGGGLHIGSDRGNSGGNDFVPNVVCQNVVIFTENIDCREVLIENIRRPRGNRSVDGPIEWQGEINANGGGGKQEALLHR